MNKLSSLVLALVPAVTLPCACQSTADERSPSPHVESEANMPCNVEELVERYQRQSGVNLTYDEQTARLLASLPVTRIGAGGPAGTVYRIGPAAQGPTASVEFGVIPLQNADGAEVASALQQLVQHARDGAPEPEIEILTDPRTNSLLVMAPADHMEHIRALAVQLDAPRGAEGDPE